MLIAAMSLVDDTKTALDDSRTLMLGSTILLGFQLQAPFQNAFDALTQIERNVELCLVPLMVAVIGFLITPSARHRLVEHGRASAELNHFISVMSRITIPVFALALALDLFIAGIRVNGFAAGLIAACAGFIVVLAVCGSLSFFRMQQGTSAMTQQETPLSARIDYILTEARVILPGAQAILGFQFAIVLTQGFAQMSSGEQIAHGVAILLVAAATTLLMAPAARHRLIYDGGNLDSFNRSSNRYLLGGTVLLATGITADVQVVAMKITDSLNVSIAVACLCAVTLFGLWHVWPLIERVRRVAHERRDG